MQRILHFLDDCFRWEQGSGLSHLRNRLNGEFQHVTASVGLRPAAASLGERPGRHFVTRGVSDVFTAHLIARWAVGEGVDLIHAWGMQAGIMAMIGTAGQIPVVTTVFDPMSSELHVRALRTLISTGRSAVLCSAATVRRRLIEHGLPSDRCIVVRPGIDFGAVNQFRRMAQPWRDAQGSDRLVVITPPLDTANAEHEIAAHAAIIRRYIDPRVRLIVPGCWDHWDHRLRWVMNSDYPETLISLQAVAAAGLVTSFEQLLALADVLMVPARHDTSTTAIAWAMASSVLVVAGAVYSTSELLAHQHNALLAKPRDPKVMAFKMAALLSDLSMAPRLRDTARGQAFEVFSLRRYVDQMARVYKNVLEGRAPGDQVEDPALVA